MLSVLIPIYNSDIRSLVAELDRQCASLSVPYEILLIDDHSCEDYHLANQEIAVGQITYHRLPQNIGRAAIRNLLQQRSKYEWLLYLDSDVEIISPDMIRQYLMIKDRKALFVGGVTYGPTPEDRDLLLHWTYGSIRESPQAANRQKSPAQSIHTPNLFGHSDIFKAYPFDTDITGYGYEDVLFGRTLRMGHVDIYHLDLPVRHLGLKSFDRFISDQKEACKTLADLYTQNKLKTKLTNISIALGRSRILTLIRIVLPEMRMLTLLKRHPKQLWRLDLLKTYWFYNHCDEQLT